MRWMEALSLLLKVSRPIFWPLMLAVYIGGIFVGGTPITLYLVLEMFVITLPLSILTFGINDIYDYDTDRKNARKRDIEGVVLHPKYHSFMKKSALLSFIALLAIGVIISLVHDNWHLFVVLVILSFLAYSYSARPIRLKEIPVIDSLSNGFAVILVAIFGFLHGQPLAALPLKAWFIGLAIAGFHALTTIPDYKADMDAGVKTFSTVLGKRSAALFALAALIALLLFSGIISGTIRLYISISALLILSVLFYPDESYSLIVSKIIFLLSIAAVIIFIIF